MNIRVTPEIEANVLAARERLGSTASRKDISEIAGVPPRTVGYVLTDLPRLRGERNEVLRQPSLKVRIVKTLETHGAVSSVVELRRLLGGDRSAHDVVHVLHSLHKQGKVDFIEQGNHEEYKHIRLTNGRQPKSDPPLPIGPKIKPGSSRRSMQVGVDYTEQWNQPTVAPGGPVERVPGPEVTAEPTREAVETSAAPLPEPEPEQHSWPRLDLIIERAAEIEANEATAQTYLRAAEVLAEVDKEEAERLLAKAAETTGVGLNPDQQEYLRYHLSKENQ